MDHTLDSIPYLTPDLPGIGGRIKERASDFQVEEIPLYEPCGEGTHTYFAIEKQGLSTLRAVRAGSLIFSSTCSSRAPRSSVRRITRQSDR